jgi:DNA repair protein RecN (Recombination protein N)
VISRSGQNRITVNGSPMTLSLLEELTEDLVDVTGQREHHSLLRAESHLEVLDAYGGLEAERDRVDEAYERLRALSEERAALEAADRERAAREDFLAFQVKEIRAAGLRAGEEEELQIERARLRSAERLLAAVASGEQALYEADEAAAALLARVERELDELASVDPALGAFAGRLAAARAEVEDVARSLGQYGRGVSADPGRQAEVEERLALLSRLKRKYGGSVPEVLATGERLAAELERLTSAADRLEALAREVSAAEAAFSQACRALSQGRRAASRKLGKALEGDVGSVALAGARFDVQVSLRPPSESGVTIDGARAGPKGMDRVEILFSPNPGEGPRPLGRIASGGELSRVTLALKLVLADADPVDTYVFDEVDAGIGGATGEVLGRKLRDVSRKRQVLCVTHLPQIAAFADRHYRVEKRASRGRTVCVVEPLSSEERKAEVARMLGGVKVTEKTRAHAEEMIRAAASTR